MSVCSRRLSVVFLFFKQKTAYEMRISDWSSDVCSSDLAVLVEQGQLALGLQHPLDHEHHVGAPRVIFVKDQCRGGLQRPGKQAFSKFGDLLPVPEDDRVAADQVDAADMRVEVDADARPFQTGRDLLDMRRLAGAVRSEEHTSELQSLMRISYAVFCLKKKK